MNLVKYTNKHTNFHEQLYHNQALGFHSNHHFQYHVVSMVLKCKNQKQQTNTHTVSKHKKHYFNQKHI